MSLLQGIPVIDDGFTADASQEASAIVKPAVDSYLFGTLAGAILRQFQSSAVIVLDPNTGRCKGTTNSTTAAALRALFSGATDFWQVKPDPGQFSPSVTWQTHASANWSYPNATDPVLQAVKPSRTVASMVNVFLSKFRAGYDYNRLPFVVVDQVNGRVEFYWFSDTGPKSAALAAVGTNSGGKHVGFVLTPPADAPFWE